MVKGETRGKPMRRADMRERNRQQILQLLWSLGPASRADIARSVGLTPATVSAIVRALQADGLVEETGQVAGDVGKPATLLAVVADAVKVLSLDLSPADQVVGAIVDWSGKVDDVRRVDRDGREGEELLALITDLATSLARQTSANESRPPIGIGVGAPGLVDRAGVVRTAAHLGWVEVDLSSHLQEAVGLDALVTNDANAAAYGDLTFGHATSDNVLLVKVDEGVGAGFVLNRQPFLGDGLTAGEIGHVVVDNDGAECPCGRNGCLETVVSAPLLKLRSGGFRQEEASSVIRESGRQLGQCLAMVIGGLNITDIVFSGHEEALSEVFRSAALDAINDSLPVGLGPDVRIRPTSLGFHDVLYGAAGLVINNQLGLS